MVILTFTNDWFSVVAGNVVESDSVVVEIVEDAHTELIALSVVRLSPASSKIFRLKKFPKSLLLSSLPSSMRPVDTLVRSARGPGHAASVHAASSPEIFLALSSHEAGELGLFAAVVDTDGPHTVLSA